jgi:LmbE family N-acetylglucosaminyl deacetylase
MQASDYMAAAERLPFADASELIGPGGLLVVAPHPDDESLGCGGLVALARATGVAVHVVVVSDGTGSHPNSPAYPPERLRALRESEAAAAVAALGIAADGLTFLRLPDGHVPGTGPEADRAAERIASLARGIGATAMTATWRHDPHRDHQATFAIASLAWRRLGLAVRLHAYPIWGWSLAADTEVGGPPRGARLDITPKLEAKRAAIRAHRSQITNLIDDDPMGHPLPPEMLARFERPFEIYLRPES